MLLAEGILFICQLVKLVLQLRLRSASCRHCSSAAVFSFASWSTSLCSPAFASVSCTILLAQRVLFIRQPVELALQLRLLRPPVAGIARRPPPFHSQAGQPHFADRHSLPSAADTARSEHSFHPPAGRIRFAVATSRPPIAGIARRPPPFHSQAGQSRSAGANSLRSVADCSSTGVLLICQPAELALQLRLLVRQFPALLVSRRFFIRKLAELALQPRIRFDQLPMLLADGVLFIRDLANSLCSRLLASISCRCCSSSAARSSASFCRSDAVSVWRCCQFIDLCRKLADLKAKLLVLRRQLLPRGFDRLVVAQLPAGCRQLGKAAFQLAADLVLLGNRIEVRLLQFQQPAGTALDDSTVRAATRPTADGCESAPDRARRESVLHPSIPRPALRPPRLRLPGLRIDDFQLNLSQAQAITDRQRRLFERHAVERCVRHPAANSQALRSLNDQTMQRLNSRLLDAYVATRTRADRRFPWRQLEHLSIGSQPQLNAARRYIGAVRFCARLGGRTSLAIKK